MQKISLRKNQERRIRAGHPWVFSNEIWKLPEGLRQGEAVEVLDGRGHYLGNGFYNGHSLISVRLFTRKHEALDQAFFDQRLAAADALRRELYPGSRHYRLCYGESDGLPGLIVDRYGDQLVVEIMSLGIDLRRELVVKALTDSLKPACIYERSDSYSRKLEGLPPRIGALSGELKSEAVIEENGLKFTVDLEHGQKTGWFFDQRDNRLALRRHVRGKTVLDAYCHTGGFALNAAAGGAKAVTGLDVSEQAVARARQNAALNGLDGSCAFQQADLMQALKHKVEAGELYDVVVLDPPAFAKNKKSVEPALAGYKEINLRAIKLLPPGGVLVSCSCSYHIEDELFRVMLVDAARDAGRQLQLLEFRHQSQDHPVLLAAKETQYLKCAVMRVV